MRIARRVLLVVSLVASLGAAADSCSSGSTLQGGTPTAQTTLKQSVAPTPAPTPLTLSGTGSKVTDHFNLDAGNYKVDWTAQGHDNFIVHIHGEGSGEQGLVNEIPPDPASGEILFQSGGGSFFLDIQASTLRWTITFTLF
jgi:hypothetical protein